MRALQKIAQGAAIIVHEYALIGLGTVKTLTPPELTHIQTGHNWNQVALNWLTNLGSARTRRAYTAAWNLLLAYTGKDPASITQSDVLAYRCYLEHQRGISQATINQYLSAISSFYRFAAGCGLRVDTPADGVKRKAINPYGVAPRWR